MANLITVSAFTGYDGDTQSVSPSPSVSMLINTFHIQDVQAYAGTAISGVNTRLTVSYQSGNSNLLGTLLVNEAVSDIKTAANAALA